jgi:glycosyltransferase involved in cell wall biosynthesis
MKFSIITVCKNSERLIEKTILSVVSQKRVEFEYIIIDGKSNDGTIEIIKKYAKKYPIKLISEKDSGIYEAMNKGIRIALGEWIHFLHSGDLYTSEYTLAEITECSLDKYDVITTPILINKEGKLKSWYPKYLENERHYYFPHTGIFIKSNFYLNNKLYRERFKIISDGLYYSDNFHKANILIKSDIKPTVIMDEGLSSRVTCRYIYENLLNITVLNNFSLKYRVKLLRKFLKNLISYYSSFINLFNKKNNI